jgi:hypothetical protein
MGDSHYQHVNGAGAMLRRDKIAHPPPCGNSACNAGINPHNGGDLKDK